MHPLTILSMFLISSRNLPYESLLSSQLRASFHGLPDKDLSKFLVQTHFKGFMRAFASILFVFFRSVKCMIEQGVDKCGANSMCGVWISIFVCMKWGGELVHQSIEREWQSDLKISKEKIGESERAATRRSERACFDNQLCSSQLWQS